MGDIQQVAQQFVNFYYQTFDADRKNLAPLYRDSSMLTWEQKPIQGTQAIIQHLSELPFSSVQHQVATLDAQPSSTSQASLIVLVTGNLVIDGGPNTLSYSQTFQLIPEGGTYYVFNDVFRLVYGA